MSRPSRQAAAVVERARREMAPPRDEPRRGLERRRRPGAPPQRPPGGLDRLERRRGADDLARRGAHAAPRRADVRADGESPVEREVALGHRRRGRSARARSGDTPLHRETARAGSPPPSRGRPRRGTRSGHGRSFPAARRSGSRSPGVPQASASRATSELVSATVDGTSRQRAAVMRRRLRAKPTGPMKRRRRSSRGATSSAK